MLGALIDHPNFRCPAPVESGGIEAVAEVIGHQPLPPLLVELWGECDGVYDEAGQWFVIWPVRRLVEVADANYYPGLPPELFAFGDDGSGDPFCLNTETLAVERWGPLLSEREQLSSSLGEFLQALARSVGSG